MAMPSSSKIVEKATEDKMFPALEFELGPDVARSDDSRRWIIGAEPYTIADAIDPYTCGQQCLANTSCGGYNLLERRSGSDYSEWMKAVGVPDDPALPRTTACRLFWKNISRGTLIAAPTVVRSSVFGRRTRGNPIQQSLAITGIPPGTQVKLFCAAGNDTGHNDWQTIAQSEFELTTQGCAEGCGEAPEPTVSYVAGFVSNETIGLVVTTNKEVAVVRCLVRRHLGEDAPQPEEVGTFCKDLKAAATEAEIYVDPQDLLCGTAVTVVTNEEPVMLLFEEGIEPQQSVETYCVAEAEGVMSKAESVEASRRVWFTPNYRVRIQSIGVTYEDSATGSGQLAVVSVDLYDVGAVWCEVMQTLLARIRVPDASELRLEGAYATTAGPGRPAVLPLPVESTFSSYEIYCTATVGFEITDVDPPFPQVRIKVPVLVGFLEMNVQFEINRPGFACCDAYEYIAFEGNGTRVRPPPPTVDMLAPMQGETRFCYAAQNSGIFHVTVAPLNSGTVHDVFCYTEEIVEEMSQYNARFRSDQQTVLSTRTIAATLGPTAARAYPCSMGEPCELRLDPARSGFGDASVMLSSRFPDLNPGDPIALTKGACASCMCAPDTDRGHPDGNCKNGWCFLQMRLPGEPRCRDEILARGFPGSAEFVQAFPSFQAHRVSFEACGESTPLPPGHIVTHAANGSLAVSIELGTVKGFDFPAGGGLYQVCWCDRALSEERRSLRQQKLCDDESPFWLPAGRLHLAGPVQGMAQETHICLLGQKCIVSCPAYALTTGARLLMTGQSCSDTRNPDDKTLQGAPDGGISMPQRAAAVTGVFTWSDRLVLPGGTFELCWCAQCGLDRAAFSVPAGYLDLLGPLGGHAFSCYFGWHCSIGPVQGTGLAAGDKALLQHDRCSGSGVPLAGAEDFGVAPTIAGDELTYAFRGNLLLVGKFALCWCPASVECQLSNFRWQLGTLKVQGPEPLQKFD
jgi:hypothetical protein